MLAPSAVVLNSLIRRDCASEHIVECAAGNLRCSFSRRIYRIEGHEIIPFDAVESFVVRVRIVADLDNDASLVPITLPG